MANNPNDDDPTGVPPKKKPGEGNEPEQELDLNDIGHGETVSYEPSVPTADPASGNLEPIAPASGWLDEDAPTTLLNSDVGVPASVEHTELFEEPLPVVEGSDIFSESPVPPAAVVEGSDVLAATMGEPPPAMGLDSDELPVADEVPDSSSGLFDSPKLAPPTKEDDSPSYGRPPELTPDASSILAALTEPDVRPRGDSSSIRVESPGIGRTLSSQPSTSTEFDLNVGDGDVPPELEEAEAAARGDIGGKAPSESDLFIDPQRAEIKPGRKRADSDKTDPDSLLTGEQSSIFFGSKPPTGSGSSELPIATPTEEDISVEFSDHPTAEPEGSDSALLDESASDVSIRRPTPRPPSEVEFGLPPEGTIEDSDEGLGSLPPGVLDSPSSDILRGRPVDENAPTRLSAYDPDEPEAHAGHRRGLRAPSDPGRASDPSVEIDWMAGSSSEVPVVRHEPPPAEDVPTPKAKSRPEMASPERTSPARQPKPSGKGGGWLGGALVGMVIAGGASAGVYFSGLVPNSEKTTPPVGQRVPPEGRNATETPPDTQAGTQPVIAQGRLMARVQELHKTNAAITADDAELKKAREELQAVANDAGGKGEKAAVEATIYLGVSHELAGDRAAARKIYQDAKVQFPRFAATFDAALDRLAATGTPGDGTSRMTPAETEQVLLTVVLFQPGAVAAEEPEAGTYFWKAIKLAGAGSYTEAISEIAKAKAAHLKQAKAMAGRGVNPLSDPLEQIFPRACDDLKAYWELRAAIYANKTIAEAIKKDGAEKVMKELADAHTRAATAVKLMTELTEANTRLTKAQNDLADANAKLTKANTDAKEANDKLTRANTDFKDASDKLTKANTDLKNASDKVTKTEKELKDAKTEFARQEKVASDTLARSQKEAERFKDSLAKSELDRKSAAEVITSLARELQAIKLLPEKFDNDALLAAQKSAMQRATGPTLSALLPPAMVAIGGGGLATGQLLDVAERLTKAEVAAKAATDKLAAETKRLATEHATELKTLKESHAADVKKLTDTYTADSKKLMDMYANSTAKLKDGHAAELKKLTDQFAADIKKQGDEHTTAVKKLTDGYDAKIKALDTAVATEKERAEALAAKFKTDLGNALSPAQALDIWLPLLTDLRRPADAASALATANKVIGTASADSEDAAKARTVAGWALLLTDELPRAKDLFTAARSSAVYKAAAGKPWAKAADAGLIAVDDPLASARLPLPAATHDSVAASRFLDAGISAYKAARFEDAVKALTEATKRDATNPVTWYFLGAARWGTGKTTEAKEDFAQGGEREKLSPILTRSLNDALSPIQGTARDALNLIRP